MVRIPVFPVWADGVSRFGPRTLLVTILMLVAPQVASSQVNWDAWKPRDAAETVYPKVVVDAVWLRSHLTDPGITLVDARVRSVPPSPRIPGALSLEARGVPADPWDLAATFAQAGIPSAGIVVCYSDSADPAAAGRLFWLLELAGHPQVRVLNGGLEAWLSEGGPLETVFPEPSAASFAAAPDTSRLATFPYLAERFAVPGFAVLDWRTPQAWGSGHIPHSLPFPLDRLVGSDGLLLPGPKMRDVFKEWGPRPREYVNPQSEFIVAGDDPPGALAVHPYLAARMAGIERVRVYPEGFTGWQDLEAPVTRLVNAEFVRELLRKDVANPMRTDLPPADALLFDLRGFRDWEIGHIPGAVWLPANDFDALLERAVAEFWPAANRSEVPVVVYCYGPTCTRSRNCTTFAARHGFRRLFWFKDGPEGWLSVREKLVDLR